MLPGSSMRRIMSFCSSHAYSWPRLLKVLAAAQYVLMSSVPGVSSLNFSFEFQTEKVKKSSPLPGEWRHNGTNGGKR